MGILSLIPGKDYIYGGIIVALLLGFWGYSVHERHVGAAKVTEAVRAVGVLAQEHNKDVQALANAQSSKIGVVYEKVIVPPVPDIPGIVCHRSGSRQVPRTASDTPSAHGTPARPEGHSFNPSSALLTVGRNADAQIAALQAEIRVLINEMNGVLPK